MFCCKGTDAFWLEKYFWLNILLLIHTVTFPFRIVRKSKPSLWGLLFLMLPAWPGSTLHHLQLFNKFNAFQCFSIKEQLVVWICANKVQSLTISGNLLFWRGWITSTSVPHIKNNTHPMTKNPLSIKSTLGTLLTLVPVGTVSNPHAASRGQEKRNNLMQMGPVLPSTALPTETAWHQHRFACTGRKLSRP